MMDGWLEGGTAGGCNPVFRRTILHRRAHQTLLWSDHSELVESLEQMFCQYTPVLLFWGRLLEQVSCLIASITMPFMFSHQVPDSTP